MKKYYLFFLALCSLSVNAQTNDEHEYVDLGLPSGTLWAKTNIGATNIYDYGDYFIWGETDGYKSGRTDFSLDAYKYYKTTTTTDDQGFVVTKRGWTKYVVSYKGWTESLGYDGYYDDKLTLESSDDAATVNWGGNWSIPTESDWTELKNNCTWTYAAINGVNGYKVSDSKGNYIYLPCAGSYDTHGYSKGSGCYLSSNLRWDRSDYIHGFYLDQNGASPSGSFYRIAGRTVRPVRSNTTNINTIQETNSISDRNCNKHFVDGTIIITKNGKKYNVSGAEIK